MKSKKGRSEPMKACKKNLTLLPLWFISITLILYACASGHQAPFTDTPPPQRNLSAYEQRLQKAVTSSGHLSLEKIGRVSYPGFEAPRRIFRRRTNIV